MPAADPPDGCSKDALYMAKNNIGRKKVPQPSTLSRIALPNPVGRCHVNLLSLGHTQRRA